MIAKRKARRKEPADEEVVVVCVPFSLGIVHEADEGKIFVIFVFNQFVSLSLSLKRENASSPLHGRLRRRRGKLSSS